MSSDWEPRELVIVVIIIASVLVVDMALGLGLGIGLNNDPQNLVAVTSTTTSTLVTLVTTPLIILTFSSSLTTNSYTYSPPYQPTPNHYHELMQIVVATAGDYTFQSSSNINLYGYFYQNNFNVYNPSMNVIASDDDSAGNGQFLFTVSFQAAVEYFLLVTTYYANVTGSYTITASGPGYVVYISTVPSTTTAATSTTTKTTTPASVTSFIF